MASEANTKRAKELLPCLPVCGLQLDSHHHGDCPRHYRRKVAAALDAAEQRGREEALASVKGGIEQGIVKSLLDYDAVVAELRRLRERIEQTVKLAEYHAKKLEFEEDDTETAEQHRGFARVLRSLLADDAKAEETP